MKKERRALLILNNPRYNLMIIYGSMSEAKRLIHKAERDGEDIVAILWINKRD